MIANSPATVQHRIGVQLPALVVLAVLVAFFLPSAAAGSSLTFSPLPPVAGEPFLATFQGTAFTCETEGFMEVTSISGNEVTLEVTAPNCPILPPGFTDYTASTTIGPLAAGTYTIRVLEPTSTTPVVHENVQLVVRTPPVCAATSTALCLREGRFEVTAEWTNFTGGHGVAQTIPQDDITGYGVMWFFNPANPELLVKVLNACAVNGNYWIFISPGSNVGYAVTVRDVVNGIERTYTNPLGTFPGLFADTSFFSCEVVPAT